MLEELLNELMDAEDEGNKRKIERAYKKLERAGMDRHTASLVTWHRRRESRTME